MRAAPLIVAVLMVSTLFANRDRAASQTCVTTDPVVVLGEPVLPSMTQCVPP